MANIAIVIYSMYQHISTLAEEVKIGIESTGNKATIYQVAETLPDEVLTAMYAPEKPNYPIATTEILTESDGILFGFPTRFGNLPAQLKSFIDSTGGLWQQGKLYHKPAGAFISTGSNGGRETTIYSLISTLSHHGMLYIPLGYASAFTELTNLNEVHGSSPWGAGTIAGPDGSRKPSELELKIAKIQGIEFSKAVIKLTNKKEVNIATTTTTTTTTNNNNNKKEEDKSNVEKKQEVTTKKESTTTKTVTPVKEKKRNPIVRFFKKIFD
jgi:NAD(P)H dehydrogenase (quinone)